MPPDPVVAISVSVSCASNSASDSRPRLPCATSTSRTTRPEGSHAIPTFAFGTRSHHARIRASSVVASSLPRGTSIPIGRFPERSSPVVGGSTGKRAIRCARTRARPRAARSRDHALGIERHASRTCHASGPFAARVIVLPMQQSVSGRLETPAYRPRKDTPSKRVVRVVCLDPYPDSPSYPQGVSRRRVSGASPSARDGERDGERRRDGLTTKPLHDSQ